MKKNLNITLVQARIYWKDVVKNLTHFSKLLGTITATDIILFPEMFNTAFCPKASNLAEKMDGKTVSWMQALALEKNCAVAGTLMIVEEGKVYNRLVWISKNGTVQTYDKRHLFSLIKEERSIVKGRERLIVEEQGWKICPLICYDLRFPVFSRNDVDYDVLIYLANWPIKRIDAWDTLLTARAIENQSYSIGVNRIGKDGDEVLFNGHSKVVDAFGKEIFGTTKDEEVVHTVILDKDKLLLQRRQMNFLQDRDKFILED